MKVVGTFLAIVVFCLLNSVPAFADCALYYEGKMTVWGKEYNILYFTSGYGTLRIKEKGIDVYRNQLTRDVIWEFPWVGLEVTLRPLVTRPDLQPCGKPLVQIYTVLVCGKPSGNLWVNRSYLKSRGITLEPPGWVPPASEASPAQ